MGLVWVGTDEENPIAGRFVSTEDLTPEQQEECGDRCGDAFWNCDSCLCKDDPKRHVIEPKGK